MEQQMIPIPADLQMGAETAQWVYDQITTFPETHNQGNWFREGECGTRACVAGWAALAHGKEFLKKFSIDGCDCEICEIGPRAVDWAHAGMTALRLGPMDADELFRGRNSQEGVLRALKALANGEKADIGELRRTRHKY